jgi:hypothetical protein
MSVRIHVCLSVCLAVSGACTSSPPDIEAEQAPSEAPPPEKEPAPSVEPPLTPEADAPASTPDQLGFTQLPAAGKVDALLPAPEDARLALLLADGSVEIRDARTGEGGLVGKLATDERSQLRWAGATLVKLWWEQDAASGKLAVELRPLEPDAPTRRIEAKDFADGAPSVALSPDGRRVVIVSGARKGWLHVWDTESGTQLLRERSRSLKRCDCCCGETCPCPEQVETEVEFLGEGARYAAIDLYQEVPVIDLHTGERVITAGHGNHDRLLDLALDPVANRLLVLTAWQFGDVEIFGYALAGNPTKVAREDVLYTRHKPKFGEADVMLSEGPDGVYPAVLQLDWQEIVLTSAVQIDDIVHSRDPRMGPGTLVPVGDDRVARVADDGTLLLLPPLPAGHAVTVTGDRRTLVSLDQAAGNVLRWELDHV